jgi:hypothetical protein
MKELTVEVFQRLNELHEQVRATKDKEEQLALLNQIAGLIGYPPFSKRTPWAEQLIQFIQEGPDPESSVKHGKSVPERQLEALKTIALQDLEQTSDADLQAEIDAEGEDLGQVADQVRASLKSGFNRENATLTQFDFVWHNAELAPPLEPHGFDPVALKKAGTPVDWSQD